jgi:hypothetical protein
MDDKSILTGEPQQRGAANREVFCTGAGSIAGFAGRLFAERMPLGRNRQFIEWS